MEKVNKFLKKITLFHFFAFVIPFFVYLILYLCAGAFSDKVFLHSDAGFQYYAVFSYLKNVFNGADSFPYTFSFGIGGTMYGTLFYLLSSPLSLMLYLFDDVILSMFLITLIKIGLSGLSMFIYLNKKTDEKYALVFSLCYSLSSYIIIYHTNLMWLDAIVFAPLVILGIEKMIDENKDSIYIVFMLLTLITNYYMGYIVGLYSFVYFFYYLYIKNRKDLFKNNKKLIIRFLVIDVCLILSIMFILIPIYFESTNFVRMPIKKMFNFVFYSLFSGTYIGTGDLEKPANYYSFISYGGTLLNILLILYFLNKKVSKENKRAALMVLLLFYLPVIIKPLNMVWHLFTYPQGFNYRYSFLLLIFIIPKCIDIFKDLKYDNKLKLFSAVYGIISIGFIFSIVQNPYYYDGANYLKVLLTLALVFINIILIKKEKKRLLLFLLIIDLLFNIGIIFLTSRFSDNNLLKHNYSETKNLLKSIDYNGRVGMLNTLTYNDGLIFNYDGVTLFNSNTNNRGIKAVKQLYNLERGDEYHFLFYDRYNSIMDSILGIRYIGYDRLNSNYKLITTYDVGGKKYLMENENAFSLGFASSSDIKNFKYKKSIFYVNDLLNSISGEEDNYLISVDVEKINDKKYVINNFDKYNDYLLVYDGKISGNFNKHNNFCDDLLYSNDYHILFNDRKEKSITLSFSKINGDLKVYTYDVSKFKDFTKKISQLEINRNDGNLIEGSIDFKNDGVLVLTIPYERGWNIMVDGKRQDYFEVMDGFMAVNVAKGKHNIKLEYKVPMFGVSVILSIFGLVSLVIFEKLLKKG